MVSAVASLTPSTRTDTNDRKLFDSSAKKASMSDTARGDFEFLGEQLLKKSRTRPLRKQMKEFVSEHETPDDLAELRRRAKDGRRLSEIVKEDREERL